jgi:palmitoyltransferase
MTVFGLMYHLGDGISGVECHHHRPPRCHHCPVCDICILKRNHHCFFTGACIGLGNQKNFILFLLWDILGIIYALYQITPLLSKYYIPLDGSLKSIIGYFMPPFYVFFPVLGYSTWLGTFLMFLEIFLLCGCLIAGSLLINQIKLIVLNMTDYESAHEIKTYSKRGAVFNLRLIFGPNLCLLPLVLIWPKFIVKSRESDCIYGRPQYTKVM